MCLHIVKGLVLMALVSLVSISLSSFVIVEFLAIFTELNRTVGTYIHSVRLNGYIDKFCLLV